MSCICFGASLLRKKKDDEHGHHSEPGQEEASIVKTKKFSYKELCGATNNFHQSNKIGRGGFGTVYKGTLKNRTQIAVKMLAVTSKQGDREFMNEINAISDLKHPNLVELLGCCVHETNRILVYEFLENNSIDRVLLGHRRSINLNWEKRSAICLGTARGLAYLHEEVVPHIVHRDVKASNILLDKDFQPKIGDFGLAKLFPDDITHISTRVAGTTGYLAPEYALGGHLTMKADIYSFGVLTLELVSGKSSGNTNYGGVYKLLVERAWELYEEEKLVELIDPKLEEFPNEEVIKYMKVALFCTQANASRRPKMSEIIAMLSKNVRLNEDQLTPPAFFQDSNQHSDKLSNKKSTESSDSHQLTSFPMTITQVTPR